MQRHTMSSVATRLGISRQSLREDVLKRETLEAPEAESAAKRVARNSERSIVKQREADQPAANPNPSPASKSEVPAAPSAAT